MKQNYSFETDLDASHRRTKGALVRHPVAEDEVRGEAVGANLVQTAAPERIDVSHGAADDEHWQLLAELSSRFVYVAARGALSLWVGYNSMRIVVEKVMYRVVIEKVFLGPVAQW